MLVPLYVDESKNRKRRYEYNSGSDSDSVGSNDTKNPRIVKNLDEDESKSLFYKSDDDLEEENKNSESADKNKKLPLRTD